MFKITNRNMDGIAKDFVGRYAGIDYAFPSGKTVSCDEQAAAHIFGVGSDDKTAVFARYGWVLPTGNRADGHRILNNFKFEDASPKLEAPLATAVAAGAEQAADPNVHGPAPVVKSTGAEQSADDERSAPVADEPIAEQTVWPKSEWKAPGGDLPVEKPLGAFVMERSVRPQERSTDRQADR